MRRNLISIFVGGLSCMMSTSLAVAQESNVRDCLQRLEAAVSQHQRLLRSIDERTINREDRDFVGGQRITSYSVSIDGTMDVERNLEDCEYAAENYEWANDRLREIADSSADNQESYDNCVTELEDVVAQYNMCRVNKYNLRTYDGVDDCEAVLSEIMGWLRNAERRGLCP